MRIEVEGLAQLDDQLQHLAAFCRAPQALNLAVAQLIVREAVPRTPRRTGNLAGSMGAIGTPHAAELVARTPYAAAVHQGVPSRHQQPHPWLIQTAVATQAQWETAAADVLDHELDKVTGK